VVRSTTIDPPIELTSLTKQFGDTTAVDDITFTVREGEVFGLLGPNGAGKSTTLDLILGLTTPTSGTVRLFGMDIQDNPIAVRHRIGVLPEDYGLYDELTGRQHVESLIRLSDASDDPDVLRERVGLTEPAFDRAVGQYSKGMRQRLLIATALVGSPDLLVLDEPMSGLDPDGISLVRELLVSLSNDGVAVLFSSHRLSEVGMVCDRVGIVDQGALVETRSVTHLSETTLTTERLVVALADEPSQPTTRVIANIDSVEGVSADGERVVVDCSHPVAKPEVVSLLHERIGVTNFSSEKLKIESLFDAETGPRSTASTREGTGQ
jgi:ABC-2 type transport system ATP-binding protein